MLVYIFFLHRFAISFMDSFCLPTPVSPYEWNVYIFSLYVLYLYMWGMDVTIVMISPHCFYLITFYTYLIIFIMLYIIIIISYYILTIIITLFSFPSLLLFVFCYDFILISHWILLSHEVCSH